MMTMRQIVSKIEQGIRINEADALWLFQSADLGELGQLANRVNLRRNGKAVFYNINRHINPTNICALSCKFCAYSKKIGEEGGYAYEIDEMIAKAGEAINQGATELHMVGGLHPRWNFQRYVDMIAAMRKAYPDVHLKAFTAVELDWMARKSRKTIAEVMTELRDAGLNSFPGGGAEIFHPDVRDQICDTKVSGEQWIDTHRTAHKLGLRSNCTMLYGHIESYEHRVDHMRRLRDLQDETGGFNVFIPLAFQPFQNEMGVDRYTFGADDLRTIAVARLYLDNFKHIKSYWVMLGQDIAQLALQFGANDLDGTVLEEKISRAAGGRSGMIMTRSNLESLIRRSGRIPVERTTLYEPVHEADRVHMTPASDDGTPDDAKDLLLKLASGETIAPSDLWKIAMTASLTEVAASLRTSSNMPRGGVGFSEAIHIPMSQSVTPQTLLTNIQQALADASATTLTPSSEDSHQNADQEGPNIILDFSLSGIKPMDPSVAIRTAKGVAPSARVIARGLSWIDNGATTADLKPTEYLAKLRAEGLDMIEEAPGDRQLPLDHKWLLIACACAAEIAVVPVLTLRSLANSTDWSSWAEDLTELRSRLVSNPLIFAVSLRVLDDSLMMPSEYMMAVALGALYLPKPVGIWTPICGMPALSPQKGLGAAANQHPVTKLVSTVPMFGTSNLGMIPANRFNTRHVWEDLRASGAAPRVLTPRQHEQASNTWISSREQSLRHVPQMDS
jgi:aminodeoxyfutalosine synthase